MASIPLFIIFVLITIINDYSVGLLIEKYASKKYIFLLQSIIINLGILFFFKYFNFFTQNIEHLLELIGWNYSIPVLKILVPIGLSFYTFKSLSYTIEVYRGNQKTEHHPGIYALYVLYYPEILAGPIDRPQNLLHQLHNPPGFDYERITNGLKLITWGFFQKLVIADRLTLLVNRVYENPRSYTGIQYVLATFFFAIQLYCDFSGYTDIAIGVSKILGFDILKNFERPYFSKSVTEFWRRWHISLSNWMRDYLYTPVSISTRDWGKFSVVFSLLLTFIIVGLWHGANLNFTIFGLLNGIYLSVSFLTRKIRKNLLKLTGLNKFPFVHSALSILFTFSLICFNFIFFRSNTFDDALYIITHIYTGFFPYIKLFVSSILSLNFNNEIIAPLTFGLRNTVLYLALFFTAILIIIQMFQTKITIIKYISEKPFIFRWTVYILLIIVILMFGEFGKENFIYANF